MLKLGDEPLPTGTPALTKPVQAKKESGVLRYSLILSMSLKRIF